MAQEDNDPIPFQDSTIVQGKDKAFLQFLISRHLDGINYLIRQKSSGTKDEAALFSVINSSLKAFEAMVLPIVSEDYEKNTRDLKTKCDRYDKLLRAQTMDWVDCFNPLMEWYTSLIKELSRIGMLPIQEVEVEVESYDWDDGKYFEVEEKENAKNDATTH